MSDSSKPLKIEKDSMFPWTDKARRARLLNAPWPEKWENILDVNCAHTGLLKGELAKRWRQTTQVLVWEKNWEGCDGLAMTDEVKVTTASQAALLLLGMQHDYFAKVRSIVMFPSQFELPKEEWEKEAHVAAGVAPPGAVFLSWDWTLESSKKPSQGYNLVIHEFAHQLDFLDGYTNGCPELRDKEQARRWHAALSAGFEQVQRDLENDGETLLGENAAKNPTEFFSDLSECFFTIPRKLRELYPAIYDVLTEYYGLNTVEWFE